MISDPAPLSVQFCHLLVAVDFSEASAAASREAVWLAGIFGAHLTFVHGLTPASHYFEEGWPCGEDAAERRRVAAEARLRKWCDDLAAGLGAGVEVIEGSPFECLVRRASELGVDLLVLGRRGQSSSRLAGERLGSTALRVVRHAGSPVWLTDGSGLDGSEGPRRVVLATDFSAAAAAAVPVAVGLAAALGAGVTVVNVQEPLALPGQVEYERHEVEIEARRTRAAAALEDWRIEQLAACPDSVSESVEGSPPSALCRAARRLQADVLVLASRGQTSWWRALLGTTAERVAEHAPCPVLVVPVAGRTAEEE